MAELCWPKCTAFRRWENPRRLTNVVFLELDQTPRPSLPRFWPLRLMREGLLGTRKFWSGSRVFRMYDPYVSHQMTIRDLLTHKSGMGLGEGDVLFWPHTTHSLQAGQSPAGQPFESISETFIHNSHEKWEAWGGPCQNRRTIASLGQNWQMWRVR